MGPAHPPDPAAASVPEGEDPAAASRVGAVPLKKSATRCRTGPDCRGLSGSRGVEAGGGRRSSAARVLRSGSRRPRSAQRSGSATPTTSLAGARPYFPRPRPTCRAARWNGFAASTYSTRRMVRRRAKRSRRSECVSRASSGDSAQGRRRHRANPPLPSAPRREDLGDAAGRQGRPDRVRLVRPAFVDQGAVSVRRLSRSPARCSSTSRAETSRTGDRTRDADRPRGLALRASVGSPRSSTSRLKDGKFGRLRRPVANLIAGIVESTPDDAERLRAGFALRSAPPRAVTTPATTSSSASGARRESADDGGACPASNSTTHGRGYLDHAEAAIRGFLGAVWRVLFIPYALADRAACVATARGRLADGDAVDAAESDGRPPFPRKRGRVLRRRREHVPARALEKEGLLEVVRDRARRVPRRVERA